MEFRLCIVGIVIVCFCFPYIRCIFKRIDLLIKIKKICWKKGYILQATHPLWFLGGKEGKNCDCTIETEKELFAIKLFGVLRRRSVLVFTENREFYTRILVGMLLLIRESFDSKARLFPKYDFSMKNKAISGAKKLRKILLVNPVPMEVLMQAENGKENIVSPFPVEMLMQAENAKETIISPGDEVNGMEFYNLSGLLNELMR